MPWERNNSLPEVNAWFVLWFKKRQINELITQDINELIVSSLKIILENYIFRDKVFFSSPDLLSSFSAILSEGGQVCLKITVC